MAKASGQPTQQASGSSHESITFGCDNIHIHSFFIVVTLACTQNEAYKFKFCKIDDQSLQFCDHGVQS